MTEEKREPINSIPAAPVGVSLPEYQAYVCELIERMGWTKDPNEVFIRFTEEVGELAKEMRRGWKDPAAAKELAAGELADVFMYLCDLANHFDVDLAEAVSAKIQKNQTRHWDF